MSTANGIDNREARIDANDWTLFDKLMYGGLGYGAFCLPTNFFKIVFTVIFPPLGEILNTIADGLINEFPYVTWDTLKRLFNNLDTIIYSFLLTSMFYVPGLIYTLGNITCDNKNIYEDEVIEIQRYNEGENFKNVSAKNGNGNGNGIEITDDELFENEDFEDDDDDYDYL